MKRGIPVGMMVSLILIVGTALPAATAEDEVVVASPREHATRFFEAALGEDWQEAPALLLKGSGILAGSPEAGEKVKAGLAALHAKLGAPVGYELIEEQEVGASMVRLLFFLKYEAKPVVWELFYYRATDNWSLINISNPGDFRVVRSN